MEAFAVSVVVFEAYGRPVTQGSKTAVRRGGRVILIEDAKGWRPWRDTLVRAARAAHHGGPIVGPVAVSCVFVFARPAAHYGTGRNAGRVKAGAPSFPATRGTGAVDKLVRAVLDPLTIAGVIEDDSRVVECRGLKLWAGRDEREGVYVVVKRYALRSVLPC